ncbi:MAG: Ivy family c-type lysozyme inhibitor [Pseudomonadota bacterium]
MNVFVKLSAVALLGVACAACSNNDTPPATSAPAASSSTPPPAASAIPMQTPSADSSSATPPPPLTNGPLLSVILQRPSFAKAFADMDGASALPAWAKRGDNPAPSARVQVEGKTMWLSHVCEASDCQGGQLFLLTDPAQHAMQGLLVQASGGAGDSVRKLTWLGKPDASVQAFLKAQMTGA